MMLHVSLLRFALAKFIFLFFRDMSPFSNCIITVKLQFVYGWLSYSCTYELVSLRRIGTLMRLLWYLQPASPLFPVLSCFTKFPLNPASGVRKASELGNANLHNGRKLGLGTYRSFVTAQKVCTVFVLGTSWMLMTIVGDGGKQRGVIQALAG